MTFYCFPFDLDVFSYVLANPVRYIERILHGGAKIRILFSSGKTILILFLPRENKIHIFKPPCNVLFII